MDVVQFLGFIISLGAFIVLSMRWLKEQQLRRKDPQAYEKEKERKQKALKEFLKSVEGDMDEDDEEEELPPPRRVPPPLPVRAPQIKKIPKTMPEARTMSNFKFETTDERKVSSSDRAAKEFTSALDERYKNLDKGVSAAYHKPSTSSYEVHERIIPSYGQLYLKKLGNLKDLIVFQAIIGPPKGM